MTRKLKAAQDLRQLAGGELAGSAGAVAELGEAAGSCCVRGGRHCDRIYRWCSGYLIRAAARRSKRAGGEPVFRRVG